MEPPRGKRIVRINFPGLTNVPITVDFLKVTYNNVKLACNVLPYVFDQYSNTLAYTSFKGVISRQRSLVSIKDNDTWLLSESDGFLLQIGKRAKIKHMFVLG
jgi:hypothetical protein